MHTKIPIGRNISVRYCQYLNKHEHQSGANLEYFDMKKLSSIMKVFALIVLTTILSSCVLNVENTAGNLESIMGKAKNVSTLRISGPLNGDDILYLREILTSESCKVSTLDLSDASIVDGGRMAYLTDFYGDKVKVYTSKDKIGDFMFGGCRFRTVILPDTVTSIGEQAFSVCVNLKKVVMGNNVRSIGGSAFSCCSRLKNINIPDSVTSIGRYAFFSCTSLKKLVIGNSVGAIEGSAFSFCTSLKKVVIGNNALSIGWCAFEHCTGLKKVIMGNKVRSIERFAFSECAGLKEIIIPDSVTLIGYRAFLGCKSLKEKTIPDGVTLIETYAFWGCTSLYTLTIGEGIKTIGDYAFDGCDRLYEFYCYATTPPHIGSKTFTKPNTFLYVPKGSLEAYETAWGNYFTNIFEMK